MPDKPTYEELERRIRELEETESERKATEEASLLKFALLEAQLASSNDGILVVDAQGKKILQNQRIVDLFKIPKYIAENDDDGPQVQHVVNTVKHPEKFIKKITYLYNHPDERSQDEIELKDGTVLDRYSAPVVGKDRRYYGRVWTFHDITERKRADESLRESEKLLKAVFNNAGIGISVADENMNLTMVNNRMAEMFGVSKDELLKTSFQGLIPSEDLNGSRERLKAFFEGGKDLYRIEKRYNLNNGRTLWVDLSVSPIKDKDGSNVASIGMMADITNRKKTEEALYESEKQYRHLFDQANEGLMMTTVDGRIYKVNRAFAEMHGYTIDELERMDIWDLDVLRESFQEDRAGFMRRIQAGETVRFDVEHYHKDGHVFPLTVTTSMIDIEGKHYYLSFNQDITDRKLVEEELRQSEARFRALVENAPEAIAVLDVEKQVFVDFNENACSLYKLSPEVLLTKSPIDLSPPFQPDGRSSAESALEKINMAIAGESPRFEWVHRDGKGQDIHCEINLTRLPSTSSILVRGSMVDITDRKIAENENERLREQLSQAQKMESIGRLAGGVAHDFNNMLSVILGNTEMALEDIDPEQSLYENLLEIKGAAQRSADVTRQLLAFARKQTIAPEVIDLNEVIENILKMLRRLIGEDIDLLWVPGKQLWPVKMDPSQLDQILANLSVNARDAITCEGKLTIETGNVTIDKTYCNDHPGFTAGDFVQLIVSDNGCGINKEALINLFEPFYTTKGQDKGTGLGLATVYGIIKQNDGFINVYSEPNKGTSFKIYLPRYTASGEKIRAKQEEESVLGGSESILLVEDEVSILKMTAMMLRGLGYTVLTANIPGEAINLAREHNGEIQLLLTDVVMPEMNGQELFRSLLPLYPNLKSLFMSGYTANVIAHHGVLDEGINYIQKPFSRQGLSVKLREVLGGT